MLLLRVPLPVPALSDFDDDRQHHRSAPQAVVDELGQVVVEDLLESLDAGNAVGGRGADRSLNLVPDVFIVQSLLERRLPKPHSPVAVTGGWSAIGVALIYGLSIGLLLMLAVFLTHPGAVTPRGGESPASDAAIGTLLVVFLFNILFTPDFGVFSTILKILILIAFMPVAISLLFSVRTGMRKPVP